MLSVLKNLDLGAFAHVDQFGKLIHTEYKMYYQFIKYIQDRKCTIKYI